MEVIAHRGASAERPEHTPAAYDLALAQMRRRCGDAAPLRFEDVLDRYGRRTRLLVELKDPQPAWEHAVVRAIADRGLAHRVIVQSFDTAALRRVHAQAPWLRCAPLLRRRRGPRALAGIARYASAISLWHGQVDARLVAAAHAHGLAVRAWTVNAPGALARVAALGVDGVITDVPGMVAATRRPHALVA